MSIAHFAGCTTHPPPGEKFCAEHKTEKTPALTPDQIRKENLEDLNKQQQENSDQERDNIFVIQEIVKKRGCPGNEEYLVKFENYEKPVWEPRDSIPPFIITYYEKTGNSKIPPARIKHTKTIGKKLLKI